MKKMLILGAFAMASIAYADNNQAVPSVTQTQVMNVQAVASSDPSSYKNGSCFLKSLYSNRPDAWRCSVTSSSSTPEVYDPCFAVPNSSNLAVCGIMPGISDNGFTMKVSFANKPPMNGEGYWSMQLADGTYCRVYDIAPLLPPLVANKKGKILGNYGIDEVCGNNPAMTGRSASDLSLADSVILVGTVTKGQVWTAKRAYFTTNPNDSSRIYIQKIQKVQIAKVWQ
ncbi:MAG: hypothetical protein K0R66_56 [Gammaproteobacteria bacterium]|jgi:hypothetical protein|nr:hypothetical protein [Gammaproteobacteria bacterium]